MYEQGIERDGTEVTVPHGRGAMFYLTPQHDILISTSCCVFSGYSLSLKKNAMFSSKNACKIMVFRYLNFELTMIFMKEVLFDSFRIMSSYFAKQ